MDIPTVKALVFDMDGTLAATEPLHMDAWLTVLGNHGMEVDEDWFQQWVGLSDAILAASVVNDYDLGVGQETLQHEKRTLFWAKARSSAELFPGVLDGLSALRQKYPIALCTSSSDKDAEAVFSNTGLDQFFETIVTSDRVANLKPDPSPYLLACRELGMNPAQCVALEDSPAGVTAAKRAGLYVIGLTTSKEPEELKGAHIIFPETRQAMDWILELQ